MHPVEDSPALEGVDNCSKKTEEITMRLMPCPLAAAVQVPIFPANDLGDGGAKEFLTSRISGKDALNESDRVTSNE